MDDEDIIRGQMEDTRTSLTDKLETLEHQVADSVHDATSNVAQTVEAVKDSVHDTVTSVTETITAVKESLRQSVNAVKGFFDIADHVDHHPWAMMGGAVILGYVTGSLLGRGAGAARQRVSNETSPQHPPSSHAGRNGRQHQAPAELPSSAGWWQTFAPEIGKLKGLAVGALVGALQEKIQKATPPDLRSSLNEIFTSVKEKITSPPH